MARGRGGRRTPEDPAPVSGPGALSRRTDGGPGGQPIRSFPAAFQGQRSQLEGMQRAAPLANGGQRSALSPSPPPSGNGGGAALSPNGILGPTQFPSEPANAGLEPPQVIPQDPNALLRAIYARFPHPDIARLLPPTP